MKKLSLEMLRLTSGEVLQRSQMKKITGGYGSGSWVCTCGNNPPISVWDTGDPTEVCRLLYGTGGHCIGA